MNHDDIPVTVLIVLIVFAVLATVLIVASMEAQQTRTCIEAGMKWSNGQCWEEQ